MSGIQQQNFLYSCEEDRKRSNEQFVAEHALAYIVSGQTQFHTNEGMVEYGGGTIGLIRKNQLAKTMKLPSPDGHPYKSINIFLDQDSLRRYAAEHDIQVNARYSGEGMVILSHDRFIRSYFDGLLPYFEQPGEMTTALAELKTKEAIELLLRSKPSLKDFLFDFSEPHKIDLEAFMNQNFTYNVPLAQFARLTGRSLATFKRDFKKVFASAPEKWLHQKRLQQAHFLIAERNQSPVAASIEVGFENLSHFSSSFKRFFGYNASGLRSENG